MDKEALITYISKLNDRNLQHQQASGFTLWAILGLIAYLILDISDKIPSIINSTELKFYLVIFSAGVIDFLILIGLLIFSLMVYSTPFGKRRFFSIVDSRSSVLLISPICFMFLVFSIINFKAANFVVTINMSPWIFWGFSLILALNGISPFILKANRYIKSKKNYLEISGLTLEMKLVSSITYIIVSIIGLIVLYFTYRNISIPLEANQISLLLKSSIEIFVFFILILSFFNALSSNNKFDWLKNLEMEIYLDDLSESDIKERLEREYIGYNVLKWISKRRALLNTVSNECLNLLKEEKSKVEEIRKIDDKFLYEKTGRIEGICNNIMKKGEEYFSLFKETSFQLDEITKQGQIPDKEEIKVIKEAYIEWNKQLEHLEIEYNEFFKYCRKAYQIKPS